MIYDQLPQDYRDDTLADALYAREVEFFHYDFDRANFVQLLTVTPPGPYRDGISERLAATRAQMAAVDDIYAALTTQITDPVAHAAAVARVTAKREATK